MLAYEDGVRLAVLYQGVTEIHTYDYVIAATGFDPLGFGDRLDERPRKTLIDAIGGTTSLELSLLEEAIQVDLSVAQFRPRLHLPMLAAVHQGPGFPNLSCLGRLSDRILRPYVS